MGSLDSIWRYPVSSFAGERLAEGAIDATGLRGDRLYGAVDLQNGEIARPGKQPRWDATPGVAARLVGEAGDTGGGKVEIRLADEPLPDEPHDPDQPWHAADSAAAETVLRRRFGFPVALRRHPPAGAAPGPGPDGSITVSPRYTLRHIHLLSLQSLDALRRLAPASKIDARRFRPNLVVDLPDQPGEFPETQWPNGTEFTVGGARLRVIEPCRRCIFVTIRHNDLPRDPGVLRALAEHNDTNLGVVCEVVTPGAVREGDSVELG